MGPASVLLEIPYPSRDNAKMGGGGTLFDVLEFEGKPLKLEIT